MSLPSSYNPKEFEESIYNTWQNNGVGSPEIQIKNQNLETSLKKVLFATTNKHKIKIFKLAWQKLALDKHFELLTLNDLPHIDFPEVEETGESFTQDALTKAKEYAKISNLPTISQDRGFVFSALDWPGTDSKKVMFGDSDEYFNSLSKEDRDRFAEQKIHEALEKLEGKDRKMYVVQALAIALPNGEILTEEHITQGTATEKPIFGIENSYSTFFIPDEIGHTTNEFTSEQEKYDFYATKMYPISPKIIEFLHKEVGANENYSILMPPPNLTGALHTGHAFQHYLMDTLTRIHRQKAQKTLWYPGVDHAGIQLEGVIDKLIKKGDFDEKILETAPELKDIEKNTWPKWLKQNNRELWVDLAWSKVDEWRDHQKMQSSILGDTPDYQRSLFTLDERANKMINYAFQKYWEDGLIYKGSYLVNWSVGLQTAVSDVAGEIEYENRVDPFITFEYKFSGVEFDQNKNPDKAFLYEFASKYIKSALELPRVKVSTVRPETIFGDIGIAMHPSKFYEYFNLDLFERDHGGFDEKIALETIEAIKTGLLGISFELPSLDIKKIRLLISEKVDPDFGTGILKITPASDQFDYELYQEFLNKSWYSFGFKHPINRDGKLTEACGEFEGLTVEQGRLAVIKKLIETEFVPVKTEFIEQEAKIREKVAKSLKSEAFDPANYSYKEGIKFLRDLIGEELDINWDYEHNVVICERSKTVIEPLISEEFFLSYTNPVVKSTGEDSNTKTWSLNFRNDLQLDILNKILSGEKSVETRALNPEEPDKYFGDMKSGDIIELNDKVNNKIYKFNIKKVETYQNLDSAASVKLDFTQIVPEIQENYTINDIKETYKNLFGEQYYNKIQSNGLVVIWLEKPNNLQQIGLQAAEETNFYPVEFKDRAISYLESVKDWCISRDLVWGHRFPVWYNLEKNPNRIFYNFNEWQNDPAVQEKIQIGTEKPEIPGNWMQETKILDTWFSSCLWPLSTLGYLDHLQGQKNTDFETYYSTKDLVSAREIFYQWIVRMMLVSKYFTGSTPYQNVVIHPTVLDEHGRKMSKSLGNGLNVEDQIEKFSSDSLRLAMMSNMIPNRNFRLGGKLADKMCEKYRNFGNKIWNVARFFESKES